MTGSINKHLLLAILIGTAKIMSQTTSIDNSSNNRPIVVDTMAKKETNMLTILIRVYTVIILLS